MKLQKVEAPSCRGGENPIWSVAEQALYYIDNTGYKIHCYDHASGKSKTWDTPSVITTLAMRRSGGAIVTLRSGIATLDFSNGNITMLHPLSDPPPHVFNDGVIDSQGRFVIGACTADFAEPKPDGGLFILDNDGTLRKVDSGIHFSNSNCFSPDGKILYFSDSWQKTVFAYDYDATDGKVSNRRIFAETHDLGGLPDGAATDTQGRVWIAIYGAGAVACFAPDGKLLQTIPVPVKLASSVAFGGPRLDRLFITTIAHGSMNEPVEDGAGDLYVVDGLDAVGHTEHLFAG